MDDNPRKVQTMMAAGDSGMEGRKLRANISPLAAESTFHNVDLLTEILRRLPSKSVMRFKSVCKSWRALIISRYFCLLWRQHHHQCPGILLMSQIDKRQIYVPLSGPAAGMPQFELPRDVVDHSVVQSCNGFLLYMKGDPDPRMRNYWVYNPSTSEVVVLPPPRMDACKIHARHCNCFIGRPVLAFDSYSAGRVVALAIHKRRRKSGFICQVCVTTENQGAWRSSAKPFTSGLLSVGVYWRNFIVWLNTKWTLFYDVEGEVLRACSSPHRSMRDYIYGLAGCYSYRLAESGGHLHFIHDQGSHLIIKEMKHDLSGWFVKHNIELSQIETSVFRSIGLVWDDQIVKFKIHSLIEDKEGSTLVLGYGDNVVLYKIQDQKSWKLCEWVFHGKHYFRGYYFHRLVYQHVETIFGFVEN